MCGRFSQFSSFQKIQQTFNIETVLFETIPNYNVAPTQEILTIIKHDNENKLEKLHWGLVPFWARDISIGSRMINARAETVAGKPSFRNAFKKRRCLIPADGFYEWKGEKGNKQPYYVFIPSSEPFAFAGLWERWTDKDEESVYNSCTIITTAASESIREIHHRMPVILDPKFHEKWLNAKIQDPKDLEIILRDGLIHDMKYYPVLKLVNSVKNNDPNCIKPIDES
ncbi:MAG: SOS response-associated peptidase [Thermodesulfobacteriota bacterium]|nr:SOS response-associated peptidase [Thermodesulfobacteriota bacterium]